MNVLKLQKYVTSVNRRTIPSRKGTLADVFLESRKYPQFQQADIFSLQDAFRKLDVEDKGYIDEATVIKATQSSERQPYDVVRQALKEVELDSSRRVELDDYVDVSVHEIFFNVGQGTRREADRIPAHLKSPRHRRTSPKAHDYRQSARLQQRK